MGQLVKGAGTQAMFFSGLPVTGNEIGRKRKSLVLQAEFWFSGGGSVYTTTMPAGNRWGTPVLKGETPFARVSRTH